MATPYPATVEGSFEFIEAKIRRDADGTLFGGDFEWPCQWFLQNAPHYRGLFDAVWLWKDWPDRWGSDAGIDIVARTRTGELWAIQAKADHPDRAITKREIDSRLCGERVGARGLRWTSPTQVSAEFSNELTTAVMWLNERLLDIRCVRVKPNFEQCPRSIHRIQSRKWRA